MSGCSRVAGLLAFFDLKRLGSNLRSCRSTGRKVRMGVKVESTAKRRRKRYKAAG